MVDPNAGRGDAEALARLLQSKPPRLGNGRLLAIDGPAGSGKTTVARQLTDLLVIAGTRATLLSLDDLYDGWGGLEPSLATRVVEQVLEPLAAGRPASWQQYDWATASFGRWHELAPPEVLVLEGCGAGAIAHAPYTSLLVWVETSPETALTRLVDRDGAGVRTHISGWREAERHHFVANHTRERADLVLCT